jgi:hypothetical protein
MLHNLGRSYWASCVVGEVAHANRHHQTNYFFASLCSFIKLERLQGKTKRYLAALHSAFATLRTLTPVLGSA